MPCMSGWMELRYFVGATNSWLLRTPLVYGHSPERPEMANVVGLHWFEISTARSGMSGRPVAAPVLSLQPERLLVSSTNSAVEPTSASAFWQASIVPLVESSGLS